MKRTTRTEDAERTLNRRLLLKGGLAVGALAGAAAYGRYALIAPPRSERLAPPAELAVPVLEGLSEEARAQAWVTYDHPLRQYFNRGLWAGGLVVLVALDWDTRRALTDLFHAGLSEAGRARIPQQQGIGLAGGNMMQLLLCGDPRSGPWQVMLSTAHLNLRVGGRTFEGAALGGPQVYGDQRGNGRVGLPGNTYRYQLEAAHRLFAAMTAAERRATRVEQAPPRTLVTVHGSGGRFDGLPVADLSPGCRGRARDVVASILETCADEDAAYAWECLEHNGGVDALHVADYDVDWQGGRRAGDGPSQIFRLEGPAAVFHFRGEPHVHAFLNVAMDGERPISLGEPLAENAEPLAGEALRAFFETAMRAQADADAAYYQPGGVVGRLRAGMVRTGDLWVAESWVDHLVVLEVIRRRSRTRRSGGAAGTRHLPARRRHLSHRHHRLRGRLRGGRAPGPVGREAQPRPPARRPGGARQDARLSPGCLTSRAFRRPSATNARCTAPTGGAYNDRPYRQRGVAADGRFPTYHAQDPAGGLRKEHSWREASTRSF